MKYIYQFIEYINEANLFSVAALLVIIGYLIYIYNKKEETEIHLGWKILGYYLLGAFTFRFGSLPIIIPIGFIIYLGYFREKTTQNQKTKKKAATLGFIVLCLGSANTIIYNKVEYRRREIPVANITMETLKDNYKNIKEELEIGDHVSTNNFKLSYDKDYKIRDLYYSVMDPNNNKIYNIELDIKQKRFMIDVPKMYEEDSMGNLVYNQLSQESLYAEEMFEVIENTKFEKYDNIEYYEVRFATGVTNYKGEELYEIDLGNYSTSRIESETKIYDGVGVAVLPMKRVSEGSWESTKSDVYLMYYQIDEEYEAESEDNM